MLQRFKSTLILTAVLLGCSGISLLIGAADFGVLELLLIGLALGCFLRRFFLRRGLALFHLGRTVFAGGAVLGGRLLRGIGGTRLSGLDALWGLRRLAVALGLLFALDARVVVAHELARLGFNG